MMTQLQLISGVIKNLQTAKGYEDLIFTKTDKTVAGAAAIGAAALGQAAGSAILSNASMGAEIDVEYFACTVNEQPVKGRLHKVEFDNDDTIEFVVGPNEKNIREIYAARDPERRILWMLPHHTRGHLAQKRSDWKWSLILSVAITIIGYIFFQWKMPHNPDEPGWFAYTPHLIVFFMALGINLWARSHFKSAAQQATDVLAALGYADPANVDLPKLHQAAQKKYSQRTGQPPSLLQVWSYRY